MTYEDCSGSKKTCTRYVQVAPKTETGQERQGLGAALQKRGIDCRIYPNPVSDGILNIELGGEEVGQFELLNLQGKSLVRTNVQGGHSAIETGSLPTGLYLARVLTSKGELVEKLSINHN